MSKAFFDWNSFIEALQSDIKSNEDVLVCFMHYVLIINGFQCIGTGNSKVLEGNEASSQALPAGWNHLYTLRYLHQGHLYLLKGTKVRDGLLIHLDRVAAHTTSMRLNNKLVDQLFGSLSTMIPDHVNMMAKIRTEMIDGVTMPHPSQASSLWQPGRSHFATGVGANDLHPFGSNPLQVPGGGGMLFPEPRGGQYPQEPGGGLPPGAVPPGARFDPFRPPVVDPPPQRPTVPDNDELMPPGSNDELKPPGNDDQDDD